MAIKRTKVTVVATGSAGTSTGEGFTTAIVEGVVKAIHLDYSASAAATTDVSIVERNESPAIPVLTVTDNATDGWYAVKRLAKNAVSGADLTGVGADVIAADFLKVSIAQANNNDSVTATIIWDDLQ